MDKQNLLAILTIILTLLLCNLAFADGGFFPPVYYKEDINEPTQKAMIVHDGQEEQLIIQVTYQGDMDDFAWIVPVPSYPEVEESNSFLFEELHFLTQPKLKRAPGFFFGRTISDMAAKSGEQVTVHEQMQVGIYEVTILSSEDANTLIDWLNDHKYKISQKAEEIIEYYVNKRWYFIAKRVNLAPYDESLVTSLQEINPEITSISNASTLLTDQVVDLIKSETLYKDFPALSTKLDYGDEDELKGYRRDYMNGESPEQLFDEVLYNRYYEKYNGYFDSHLRIEITQKIQLSVDEKTTIPTSFQCYQKYYNGERSNCDVWYLGKDSEEYQILKDSSCGVRCPLISESKKEYSINDIAEVAAYVIVNGDEEVQSFFSVSTGGRNWYDNNEDKRKNVENQIISKLRNQLQSKADKRKDQITIDLAREFNDLSELSFPTSGNSNTIIDSMVSTISSKAFDDIIAGKSYTNSVISNYPVMTSYEYDNFVKLHNGDHNSIQLKRMIQQQVDNVLTWKQASVQQNLGEGTVQPVSIKFATNEIVYPLKISSINNGVSEILLYVFANYKTEASNYKGFDVEYAKWIKTKDIKTPSYDQFIKNQESADKSIMRYWHAETYYYLNQILDDEYFLTKMRREMWPRDMVDDLMLVQAGDNQEEKLVVYEKDYIQKWIYYILLLIVFGAILYPLFLFYSWLNNKKFKQGLFHVNLKRNAVYAAVQPALILMLTIIQPGYNRALSELLDFFGRIFEFISNFINFIGVPDVANAIIMFLLVMFLIYVVIHLISIGLIVIYRKIMRISNR